LYLLGDRQPSGPAVLADYASTTLGRLAERTIGSASVGPLAATPDGVWAPVQNPPYKATAIVLFRGTHLEHAAAVRAATPVTAPYVVDGQLWLVDGWGQQRTLCADPSTGVTLASGPPVGIHLGTMVGDSKGIFLLDRHGTDASCSRSRPALAAPSVPKAGPFSRDPERAHSVSPLIAEEACSAVDRGATGRPKARKEVPICAVSPPAKVVIM
jgi:hypothetical protein